MNVANVFRFMNCRQFVEDILSIDAITSESVNCKLANAEGSEVLEEVRTLRGVDLEAVQSCLHNDLRGTYLRPLHGNAKPRVRTSPTTWADEEKRRSGST